MNDSQHTKLWRRLAFERGGDDSSVFQVVDQLTPAFNAGRTISCDDHTILRRLLDIASFSLGLERLMLVAKLGSCPILLTTFLLPPEPMGSICQAAGGLGQTRSSDSSATPIRVGQLGPVGGL